MSPLSLSPFLSFDFIGLFRVGIGRFEPVRPENGAVQYGMDEKKLSRGMYGKHAEYDTDASNQGNI